MVAKAWRYRVGKQNAADQQHRKRHESSYKKCDDGEFARRAVRRSRCKFSTELVNQVAKNTGIDLYESSDKNEWWKKALHDLSFQMLIKKYVFTIKPTLKFLSKSWSINYPVTAPTKARWEPMRPKFGSFDTRLGNISFWKRDQENKTTWNSRPKRSWTDNKWF